MSRYRKKPVVIEAIQFKGINIAEIAQFLVSGGVKFVPDMRYVDIVTLEGTMRADIGDWVIRGVKGEFYPFKPDIFEATYEPAGAGSDKETPK